MNKPIVIAAFALITLSSGCGRWVGYVPLRIQGNGQRPEVVYQRLGLRARTLGYQIVEQDPAHLYFVVRSHLDNKGPYARKGSFFHVAVRSDSSVDVGVSGYRLKEERSLMHRKLCFELTQLLDALEIEMFGPRPLAEAI
jgi:hypothetical protein